MKYYHQDIEYTKMDHSEEISLFEKFYAGGRGSRIARDKLIFSHLRLAVMLAGRLVSRGNIPEDEAVSAANLGLLKAIKSKRFDPRNPKGFRFAAYARKYIIGAVLKTFKTRRSLVGPPDEFGSRRSPAAMDERPQHDYHDLLGLDFSTDPSDDLIAKEKKVIIQSILQSELDKIADFDPKLKLWAREVLLNGRTLEDVATQSGTSRQNISFRLNKSVVPQLRRAFLKDPRFRELL